MDEFERLEYLAGYDPHSNDNATDTSGQGTGLLAGVENYVSNVKNNVLNSLGKAQTNFVGYEPSDADQTAGQQVIRNWMDNSKHSYVDQAALNVANGAMNVMSGVASALGNDSFADATDQYQSMQPQRPTFNYTNSDYWKSPQGAWADIWQGVGSSVPMFVGGELMPASVASRGASLLGNGFGKIGLGKVASSTAGKAIMEDMIKGVPGAVIDATSEYGNAYRDLAQQGDSNARINALPVLGANMILNALTTPVEYALMKGAGSKIFKSRPEESIGHRVGMAVPRALPAIGASAGIEGTQELLQQTISDSVEGNPVGNPLNPSSWTPAQLQSFVAGAVGGGAMGAPANIAGSIYSRSGISSPEEIMADVERRANGNSLSESNTSSSNIGVFSGIASPDEIMADVMKRQQNSNTTNLGMQKKAQEINDFLNNVNIDDFGENNYNTMYNAANSGNEDYVDIAYSAMNDFIHKPQTTEGQEAETTANSGNTYQNAVINATNQYGIDPKIGLSIAARETGGDDINAITMHPANGNPGGIMQITEDSARDYGINDMFPDWRTDANQNIKAGIYILNKKIEENNGDVWAGVRAYNGSGPAADEYVSQIQNNYNSMDGQNIGNTAIQGYNLPTQSDAITDQVNRLTPQFQSVLPVVGGMLKEMGLEGAEISSAARSVEHNAEVGGAENSYHIDHGDGGDAVDIVLPEGTTDEQAQAVLQRFKDTGAFKEVLFHDVGSGYHLHLGGYNGGLNSTGVINDKSDIDLGSNPFEDDLKKWEDISIPDVANDIKDTSQNINDVNLFDTMFTTDHKGKDKFINSEENRQVIKNQYGEDLQEAALKAMAENILQNPSVQPDQDIMAHLSHAVKTGDTGTIKQILRRWYTRSENLVQAKTSEQKNTVPTIQSDTMQEHYLHKKEELMKRIPTGNTITVRPTASTDGFSATYKVMPAADVVASHTADYVPNKFYPNELQPRDRQRVSMQKQVEKMARTLQPELLVESPFANQGAPIVNNRGVVLNGNGRTMAVQKAYATPTPVMQERSAAYKKYLVANAEKFGLNPDQVERMSHPVLVRQAADDADTNAIIHSTEGGAQMGAAEQAKSDANKIKLSTLEQFIDNGTGEIMNPANREFRRAAAHDLATDTDANVFYNEHGDLTPQGRDRIKNAMFSKAYHDDLLLAKLSESTDNNSKNVMNAMMAAAPQVAQVNEGIKNGTLYDDYDISTTIADTAKTIMSLRDAGKPLNFYLKETSLFDSPVTPAERSILEFIDRNKFKSKNIADLYKGSCERIFAVGSPEQQGLFGAEEAPQITLLGIIDNSIREVEGNGIRSKLPILEGQADEGRQGTLSSEPAGSGRIHRQEASRVPQEESGRKEEGASVKESLADLARRVWTDPKAQGRVDFIASDKLRNKTKKLLGHEISTVFITADDIRHIKKHHSEHEEKRGQISLTEKDIADIYDTINDFDTATIENPDKKGNKKMMTVKDKEGRSYVLLIERGKDKAEVKTAYKKPSQMSDVTSPEPNVRNDSEKVSSTPNVAQMQEEVNEERDNSHVNESDVLYKKAAKKFPQITEKDVSNLVKDAIQTTLDFGQGKDEIHVVFKNKGKEKNNPSFYQTSLFGRTDHDRRYQSNSSVHNQHAKQIGFGLTRKLINEGAVSLVGQKVTGIRDLAEIAQVLRHPGYEKFHKVYVKNGEIVNHETVTCMLPAAANIYKQGENNFNEFVKNMEHDIDTYQADTFYILHNHPSGKIQPSPADLHITKKIEGALAGYHKVSFGGHVILDTTQAMILQNGKAYQQEISPNAQIHYDKADIPHIALGKGVGRGDAVVAIAKTLADRSNTTAFFLTRQYTVRGVVQLPERFKYLEESRINRYLRYLARQNDSAYVTIATADKETADKIENLIKENDSILDGVYTGNAEDSWHSMRQEAPDYNSFLKLHISDFKNGTKILEPNIKYDTLKHSQKQGAFSDGDVNKIAIKQRATTIQKHVPAIKRAVSDLKSEIMQAFPNAKTVTEEDDRVIFAMPNGTSVIVDLKDKVILTNSELQQAKKDHDMTGNDDHIVVEGFTRTYGKDAYIALAQGSREGTGFHEAFHAAHDIVLTEREKAALDTYYKGDEEAQANAYAEWIEARKQGRGTMFGKLWRKIKDFAEKLQRIFTGVENIHNVMRKIESGEVWNRTTQDIEEALPKEPLYNIRKIQFSDLDNLKKFVSVSLRHKGKPLRITLGKVSKEEAAAIKVATGLDVDGYVHVWRSNDVRHVYNRHGENNEKDKTQIGLTPEEIAEAIQAIKSPNKIEKGNPNDAGLPSIRYIQKKPDGTVTVAEVIRDKNKTLSIKTMWKKYPGKHHANEGLLDTSESAPEKSSSTTITVAHEDEAVNKNTKYAVTNAKITGDTQVPVIDVTDQPEVNVNSNTEKVNIAKSLIGQTFRIIGSDGIGRVATMKEGRHLVNSSKNATRTDSTRRKALSLIEKILNNSVYVEKHADVKHGTDKKYIELFAVVRDGGNLVRFRIVAREGDANADEYTVNEARFYDIIKEKTLPNNTLKGVQELASSTNVDLSAVKQQNRVQGDFSRRIPQKLGMEYGEKSPLSTISVADLLRGVKDRKGKPYVNPDGSLIYDAKMLQEQQGTKYSIRQQEEEQEIVRPQDIIDAINDIVPVYEKSKVKGDDTGDRLYNEKAEAGFSGNYFDLAQYGRILAMHLDKKLRLSGNKELTEEVTRRFQENKAADKLFADQNDKEYTPAEARREGVSEFGSYLLENPEFAADRYPQYANLFYSELAKNKELKDKFDLVMARIQAYQEQSVEQRAAANIARNGGKKPSKKDFKKWVSYQVQNSYSHWVDSTNPLGKMVRQAEAALGHKIAYEYDVQKKSLMARSNGAARAIMLLTGGRDAASSFKILNEMYGNAVIHKDTIRDVLDAMQSVSKDDLKKAGYKKAEDALGSYLIAARTEELVAKYKDKYSRPAGFSKRECVEIMNNAPTGIKKAAGHYWNVNINLVNIMQQQGMISKALGDKLRTYKHYCPMYRDMSDGADIDTQISDLRTNYGFVNITSPVKAIDMGGKRAILDPITSMTRYVAATLNRTERNNVGKTLVKLDKDFPGLGEIIVRDPTMKSANPAAYAFSVWVNGEKVVYRTTPELYKALTDMDAASANILFQGARGIAQALRRGATISPSFITRNFIRDTIAASINSKTGFIPIVSSIKGAYKLATDKGFATAYYGSGASMSTYIRSDVQSSEKVIQDMLGTKYKDSRAGIKQIRQLFNFMWNKYDSFANLVEDSSRAAEFAGAMKKGLTIEQAGYLAKEVTLNFGRSGNYGKSVNRYVPFFNATIQGVDKFARSFKDNPKRAILATMAYIVLPSLLLWALNHDDDWYKDLDEETKLTNWAFSMGDGTHLLIPKPQEAGILFGGGVEAVLRTMYDQDPKAMGEWGRQLVMSMTPSIYPAIVRPIIEWQTNYSFWTGRNLVSDRLKRLPSEMQTNNNTSEVARAAGDMWIAKKMNLSPIAIDNFISGYSGSAGRFVAQKLDAPIDAAKDKSKPASPSKYWYEMPVIGSFIRQDGANSEYINRLYDMNETISDEAQRGNKPKGKEQVATAVKTVGKLTKEIRQIQSHPNMSPERKRQEIDKRRDKMRDYAKKALDRYGQQYGY